jgi:hypothetical protein
VDLDKWISISLEGLISPQDYTYTASYSEITNAIDFDVILNVDTNGSVLKVNILDKQKVMNSKGKTLEN